MLAAQALFGDIVGSMLGKLITVGVVLGLVILAILLQQTNPAAVGPLGILIVFVLIYLLVLGVLTILLFVGNKLAAKIAKALAVQRPVQPLHFRRAYYFASVIALAPVMFMGMQSVGEVGAYDVILVLLFVTIACVYIAKRTS